jgi:hypothetical protein
MSEPSVEILGKPVKLQAPFMPVKLLRFHCKRCQHEWEADHAMDGCPKGCDYALALSPDIQILNYFEVFGTRAHHTLFSHVSGDAFRKA